MNEIELQVFGQPVRILSDDTTVITAIAACYSAFLTHETHSAEQPLRISIATRHAGLEWTAALGPESEECVGLSYLLYVVEKLMTIELQRRRSDLFFMHAAALRFGDRCVVISGESGVGKSTLCWELCHAGFDYMSDELAPVNPNTMEVEPYPHAIGLKRATDGMMTLPETTLDAVQSMHVPVESIPSVNLSASSKINSIIFLTGSNALTGAQPTRISNAEAAARIYANGLNQLAHDEEGLDAASRIASAVPCYLLARAAIGEMREEIISVVSCSALRP